ncbi:MAG: hypothetical protein R3F14_01325 [Polyangiaceae bacterium]
MWFATTPTGTRLHHVVPHHLSFDALIEAPPERVFDIFANGEGQETWFQDFKAVRWNGSSPRSRHHA